VSASPAQSPTPGTAWLLFVYANRFGAALAFMMYAGALPAVMAAWGMSSGEAGSIQSAFNVCYAISLVVTSWLSDRFGAKRVLIWSSWVAAATAIAFACFAQSYMSALLLFSLAGLAQGGTYTPGIMLVAQGTPSTQRGAAIGWLLAAASLGYFGSIALATTLSAQLGYRVAFLVCAIGPVIGLLAAAGLRRRPNVVAPRAAGSSFFGLRFLADRRSLLLTLGYTFHCWELLGMWAWMPAFLTPALAARSSWSAVVIGLCVAAALHLSGAVASFVVGGASDRLGRKAMLVTLGIAGAACSFSVAFLAGGPAPLLLVLAALYGFSALGDSPVLSTAMTESVDAGSLGAALAVRSILGFGAGGVAPVVFGIVLDAGGGPAMSSWGWGAAFATLGLGGLLATLCALRLPAENSARRR
jgi:MFS family permease